MPELIEVETYRRQAEVTVGRTIASVPTLDPLGLRHVDERTFRDAVEGRQVTGAGRRGKLLLLHTDGPVIGLRFGMTGRLLVDGGASIEELEYGSSRDEPAWDRTVIRFDHGELRVRDPRRLGGVELDPEIDRLGPDAATLTAEQLDTALGTSTTSLKARLLDQRHIAGLGNLLVDESLWRAGLDPGRRCHDVGLADRARLAESIRGVVRDLTERGGSHTGDLQVARQPGAACPRDGALLRRRQVGGRTTYSCPLHQM